MYTIVYTRFPFTIRGVVFTAIYVHCTLSYFCAGIRYFPVSYFVGRCTF